MTEARARLRLTPRGRAWRLVDPCPFCGVHHAHAAAVADPSPSLGERESGCGRGRYRIVPEGGAKWSRVVR
jgi:hypothetical protein